LNACTGGAVHAVVRAARVSKHEAELVIHTLVERVDGKPSTLPQ
jgi:hypothetical protein